MSDILVHGGAHAPDTALLERLRDHPLFVPAHKVALRLFQHLRLEPGHHGNVHHREPSGIEAEVGLALEPVPVTGVLGQAFLVPAVHGLGPHTQLVVGDPVGVLELHYSDETLAVRHGRHYSRRHRRRPDSAGITSPELDSRLCPA